MYKSQNISFGQIGKNLGVIQEQHLQEYIHEYPEHSVSFSQWLLDKKYLTQFQISVISKEVGESSLKMQKTGKLALMERRDITQTNAADATHPPVTNSLRASTPNTIGRYQIISVLGQGGMGKVYKVFDPVAQKEFALKVLLVGDKATKQAVVRFKREAETMTKLDHPGIVKAYDIGFENNQMFFTMDLVSGVSLKDLQLSKAMGIKKSVEFMIKVCETMAYAHDEGVVHRDLKPANIMAYNDHPIIMDFGLAKLSEVSQQLSKTGTMMGTLRYMPPEQVEGRHSEITAQSDVYSIGAILYELLSGRPIFNVTSHLSLINFILNKDPVPLCEVNPKVPKVLEDICSKAFAKKKKDRYISCSTLAKDLKKFIDNNTSQRRSSIKNTRPKNIKRQKAKSNSMNKVIITISCILCVILLIITTQNSSQKEQNKNLVKQEINEDNNTQKNSDKPHDDKNLNKINSQKETTEKIPSLEKVADKETLIYTFDVKEYIQGKQTDIKISNLRAAKQNNRFIIPPQGSVDISFVTTQKYSNLFLKLNHLSSAGPDKKNYSPITIIVNNQIATRDFIVVPIWSPQHDTFDISNYITLGNNSIRISVSNRARTFYWLYNFEIFTKEKE